MSLTREVVTKNIRSEQTLLALVWNEHVVSIHVSSNWRARLLPAAAVITAPGADEITVAVKKLLVGLQE